MISDINTDVAVRRGTVEREPDREEKREECRSLVTPSRAYYHFDALGTIEIRDGRDIVVDVYEEADARAVRSVIENLAMGALLHQRGQLVLHGSAVCIEGCAIALIGDKGWGKSTMAAALYRRGHTVLTDDVLALQLPDGGQPHVLPAFPQLKLWPDAVQNALGESAADLDRIHREGEKRVRRLSGSVPTEPHPLTNVYVLGGASDLQIDPVAPQDAFKHLLRHTYAARILRHTNAESRHLRQITQLVSRVSVQHLRRPQDLTLLQEIGRRLEAEQTNQI